MSEIIEAYLEQNRRDLEEAAEGQPKQTQYRRRQFIVGLFNNNQPVDIYDALGQNKLFSYAHLDLKQLDEADVAHIVKYYQDVLDPNDIIKIINFAGAKINPADMKVLVTIFTQFSDHTCNEAVYINFIVGKFNIAALEPFVEKLSPAMCTLLAEKYRGSEPITAIRQKAIKVSLHRNAEMTEAINALARNRVNYNLVKLSELVDNAQYQPNEEQAKYIKYLKVLEAAPQCKDALDEIKKKPAVKITEIPQQLKSPSRNLSDSRLREKNIDLKNVSVEPQNIKVRRTIRKEETTFAKKPFEDSVKQTWATTQKELPYSILNAANGSYYISDITLGGGAFGKVKLAQNMATGEWVAIKIFKRKIPENGKIDRASEEASHTLKNLELPDGQKAILDEAFVTNSKREEKHYMVIPFVKGTNFYDLLFDKEGIKKAITPEKKLAYSQSLVDNVLYYHKLDLALGDIKPLNCLIDGDNIVPIDLDGARKMQAEMPDNENLWAQFTELQTQRYKAPEGHITKESDVYALAVVLAEIFSEQPYNVYTSTDMNAKHFEKYLAIEPTRAVEKAQWALCKIMADQTPSNRPTLGKVQDHLKNIQNLQNIKNITNVQDLIKMYKSLRELDVIKDPLVSQGAASKEALTAIKEQFMVIAYNDAKALGGGGDVTPENFQKALQHIKQDAGINNNENDLNNMLSHRKHVKQDNRWNFLPGYSQETTSKKVFDKATAPTATPADANDALTVASKVVFK